MYEQVSHSLLNSILNSLPNDLIKSDLRHFYTRLGANFYAIHSLMKQLYGQRDDFEWQMQKLVEVMARQYKVRSQILHELDLVREKNHNWFLDQKWVGMALYSDGFAGDLMGLHSKLSYFQELGVNEKFGYKFPNDLRRSYASFYWERVSPYIKDALEYLRLTEDGKQWIANMYSHVFDAEHSVG